MVCNGIAHFTGWSPVPWYIEASGDDLEWSGYASDWIDLFARLRRLYNEGHRGFYVRWDSP